MEDIFIQYAEVKLELLELLFLRETTTIQDLLKIINDYMLNYPDSS